MAPRTRMNVMGDAAKKASKKAVQTMRGTQCWEHSCEVCGEKPTVGDLGLCGPCCFGEADAVDGNW